MVSGHVESVISTLCTQQSMANNSEEEKENGITYFVDEEGQYYFQPALAEKDKDLDPVPAGNNANTADISLEDPMMVHKINAENCQTVSLAPLGPSNRELSYVLVVQEENKSNIWLGVKVDQDKIDVYIIEEEKMGDLTSEEKPNQPPYRSTKVRAQRLFICNFCTYTSDRRRTVLRHWLKHSVRARAHKCVVCESSFKDVTSLRTHIRKHTGVNLKVCNYCNSQYTNKTELIRHIRYKHTQEKPHKCTHCDYSSVELSNLRRHMRSHADDMPFKCQHCTYGFQNSYTLKRHLCKHRSEKPFQCQHCTFSSQKSNELKRHLRTHTTEKTFQCQHCTFCTQKSNELKRHLRTHTTEIPFQCQHCTFSSQKSKELKRHLRTHITEKPYKCDMCSKCFTQLKSLTVHQIKHNVSKKPLYQCELCPAKLSRKDKLGIHIQKLHSSDKPLECKRCGKFCPDKHSYNVHYKTHVAKKFKRQFKHTDEMSFSCDLCGKSFSKKKKLICHLKYHNRNKTSDMPIKCKRCGKSCPDKYSYNVHNKTHVGEKFKCQLCPYESTRSQNLKTHLLKHTDEKPFTCHMCGSSFRQEKALRRHRNLYHNCNNTTDMPLECKLCGKYCPDKYSYKVHKKTHAGEKFLKCQLCPYVSNRSYSLKAHLLQHTGEKPFSCDLCGKSFRLNSVLRYHRKLYHNYNKTSDMPLECKLCGKSCPDKYSYKVHKKTHPGEKFFKCELCPYASTRSDSLRTHLLKHTKVMKSEKSFPCDLCDQSFMQKKLLLQHHDLYHNPDYVPKPPKEKIHSCHKYKKTFVNKGNLIRHLAIQNPDTGDQERELPLKRSRQKGMELVSSAVDKRGELVMLYNYQKDDEEGVDDDDEEEIILPEVNLMPVERCVKLEEVEACFGFEENKQEEKNEEVEEVFSDKVVLQLL